MKNNKLESSPFIPSATTVSKLMRTVIIALVPGIILFVWMFGWGVAINIVLAAISALIFEWLMLLLRDRPVRPFLFDGSAVVTAMLLALALPPMIAWWIPVIGCFFAIVVAKHLYGGIGYNPFNPAMAAYAILLISFPREMSIWSMPLDLSVQPLGFSQLLSYSFHNELPPYFTFDALTAATPLDKIRMETGLGKSIEEIMQSPSFGYVAGVGMEWVSIGFLLGGLWLINRKIITWHIPITVLSSLFVISSVFFLLEPTTYANPFFHLFSGAGILGAFFIATDPVTAPTTPLGRVIYGCGIGIITFAIRVWGGYPDGIAFAVLLMGLTVPLLDQYTAPRVYGARIERGKS